MPRPRSLTQDRIAAAALAVIDRDGLPALSMRTVAAELGMSTMALYRYVGDREQVEGLVVDRVLAPVDFTVNDEQPWRDCITALCERLRGAVSEHPASVPLLLRHRHASPAALRWIEATLTALTRAGFAGTARVIAQRTIVGSVLGTLQNQHYGALAGAGTAAMAQLPADEFPLLAETAREARDVTAEQEFHDGLQIVLRGLTAPANSAT